MKYIGLDIGTTNLCAVVTELPGGKVISKASLPNDSDLPSAYFWERTQSPSRIAERCMEILSSLCELYTDVSAIGISAQMHGIVYVNALGKSVSPLYTWQDGRGALPFQDGLSHAEWMSRETGLSFSTGFGAVTHFWLEHQKQLPQDAAAFCDIGDYVALQLTGSSVPCVHITHAAAIGCYSLKDRTFSAGVLSTLYKAPSLFPRVAQEGEIIGTFRNIPVYCSLGDNQASFSGSGAGSDTLLLNVGTGSQVSMLTDRLACGEGIEIRPFSKTHNLLVGAALTGGKAYALLERFFHKTLELCGVQNENCYKMMEHCADTDETVLPLVNTCFAGTRSNPSLRGSINGLSMDNLTPSSLISAFRLGIARELYDLFAKMEEEMPSTLIGAGNGLRKSPAMQAAFAHVFGKELSIASCEEEAACGAALFACCAEKGLSLEAAVTLLNGDAAQ